MTPSVSIITPCYNHALYLGAAIRSILAQRFSDWEAIIVNDGSTDGTAEVVSQFGDPRMRYIYQHNQGLSAARNTGMRAADGIYLAFLDADDEWEPEFLQCCVDALNSNETLAGVYTLNYFIDSQGTRLPQVGGHAVSRAAFRARNLEGGFFPIHAALIRADVIDKVGPFDTQLTSEEDWDLWIRISEHGEMENIPSPLAGYRVSPGSMITNGARMHVNRIMVLTKYFGPPEGDPHGWPEEKRQVYAFAYQSTARQYVQQRQPDEGWRFLAQAISTWPHLLERLDTFYELACGDEQNGYRGQADRLDIAANGATMLRMLDTLMAAGGPDLKPLRRSAYGNAHLALAILSDQAGLWGAARRYLFQAIEANPRLLTSSPVLRRLLKLSAGQRLVGFGRSLGVGQQQRTPYTTYPAGAKHES